MDYRIVVFRAVEARQTVNAPLQAPSRDHEELQLQLVEVEVTPRIVEQLS